MSSLTTPRLISTTFPTQTSGAFHSKTSERSAFARSITTTARNSSRHRDPVSFYEDYKSLPFLFLRIGRSDSGRCGMQVVRPSGAGSFDTIGTAGSHLGGKTCKGYPGGRPYVLPRPRVPRNRFTTRL